MWRAVSRRLSALAFRRRPRQIKGEADHTIRVTDSSVAIVRPAEFSKVGSRLFRTARWGPNRELYLLFDGSLACLYGVTGIEVLVGEDALLYPLMGEVTDA
jgi:hypothetical protein